MLQHVVHAVVGLDNSKPDGIYNLNGLGFIYSKFEGKQTEGSRDLENVIYMDITGLRM